jgi:hypothetical protein
MRKPSLVRELTSQPLEKPCDAPWDEMVGNHKIRRCARCALDVYDLGKMTALEAELRLLNAASAAPCIRFTLDEQGEVIHALEPRPMRPVSRAVSLAAASALGVVLAPAMADAKRPKLEPTPCVVLYGDQTIVASAADSRPPSAAAPAAAAPAHAAAAPSAAPPQPPPQPPTGGAPVRTEQPIAVGILDLRSKVPRKVTLAAIELDAPTTYRLTPGAFTLDVTDPNGKHRSVKIKITEQQTTTVDLDRR